MLMLSVLFEKSGICQSLILNMVTQQLVCTITSYKCKSCTSCETHNVKSNMLSPFGTIV